MKHADCDGNGTVGFSDTTAVIANYGNWHLKTTGVAHKTTAGAPELYFDVTGITFAAGATVTVPIKLGTSVTPVNNVYGLATMIKIDGIVPVNAPTISTATSWLGTGSSSLNFVKVKTNNSIDWVHARTDHNNNSGQGTIGTITFEIPANTPANTTIKLDFDESITRLIDYKGLPLAGYNLIESSVLSEDATKVTNVTASAFTAFIVPNPSKTNAGIQLSVKEGSDAMVYVTDITGRNVWSNKLHLNAGKTFMPLSMDNIHPGIYTVRISPSGSAPIVLKWVVE